MRKGTRSLLIIGLMFLITAGAGISRAAQKGPETNTGEEKFKTQLEEVVQAYLEIREALANDNIKAAQKGAQDFNKALAKMNSEWLPQAKRASWIEQSPVLQKSAERIQSGTDIKRQREAFFSLSNGIIVTVKNYGPLKTTLYQQYCPMAVSSRGANWLSDSKTISNPYLGQEMPTCGENKAVYGEEK